MLLRGSPALRNRSHEQRRTDHADLALFSLISLGDVFEVDGRRWLVAPLNDQLIDRLIIASGATEDDEPDNEDSGADDFGEPSLGGISACASERRQ
jgi:hypothetical protein